jgi:hypothetical protein
MRKKFTPPLVDHQYTHITTSTWLPDIASGTYPLCQIPKTSLCFLSRLASAQCGYESCQACLLLLNTMAANGLELDLPGYLAVLKILEANDVRPTDERSEVR